MLLWRKHSTHLQATTAAVWVIKYGKEEGRGENKDGSWCFIWKASGQKRLCFQHEDGGEAAFAAQWKVCASEMELLSVVTIGDELRCLLLFFLSCPHFKIIRGKQRALVWLIGDYSQFGQSSTFMSPSDAAVPVSQLFISCTSTSRVAENIWKWLYIRFLTRCMFLLFGFSFWSFGIV